MVLVPHMLVGAAIGSQVSNYWLAFLFGLMSHYLLDSLLIGLFTKFKYLIQPYKESSYSIF